MKRQGRGLATVVPILAEHCAWDTLPPLTALQLVPVDDKRKVKPLSKWANHSQALDTIRRQIQEIIDGAEKPQQGLHDIASVPTLTSAYGADDFRKLLDRAYLIDREPQSADMAAALEESFNDSAKLPIIGIAAGTADHRHELLVDLFAKESFQLRSARAPIELGAFARRVIPAIDFPFGEALPGHDYQNFVRRVAGKLHAKSPSISDIRVKS